MPARPRVRHQLKCWPEFFQATLNGLKKFELRRDDRPEGYQVGDELLLKEWDPTIYAELMQGVDPESEEAEVAMEKAYTGREVLVRVDYLMPAETVRQLIHPRLEPDEWDAFVIMSVSRLP